MVHLTESSFYMVNLSVGQEETELYEVDFFNTKHHPNFL